MPLFYATLSRIRFARRVALAIAAAAFAACSDSPAGNLPAAQQSVAISNVSVSENGSVLFIGTERELVATATDASGVRRPVESFTWTTSDEGVASVVVSGHGTASVFAKGEGLVTITATAGGISGSARIVVNSISNADGNLLIESFSVVEVQYPSTPGQWSYAPLVTMKAPAISNGGEVLSIAITIPTLGTWECRATRSVPPGSSVEMFSESIGFELEIHHADGHRIPPGFASVEVLVRENGGTARLKASAGVKAGNPPTTYTAGREDEPWNCAIPTG